MLGCIESVIGLYKGEYLHSTALLRFAPRKRRRGPGEGLYRKLKSDTEKFPYSVNASSFDSHASQGQCGDIAKFRFPSGHLNLPPPSSATIAAQDTMVAKNRLFIVEPTDNSSGTRQSSQTTLAPHRSSSSPSPYPHPKRHSRTKHPPNPAQSPLPHKRQPGTTDLSTNKAILRKISTSMPMPTLCAGPCCYGHRDCLCVLGRRWRRIFRPRSWGRVGDKRFVSVRVVGCVDDVVEGVCRCEV